MNLVRAKSGRFMSLRKFEADVLRKSTLALYKVQKTAQSVLSEHSYCSSDNTGFSDTRETQDTLDIPKKPWMQGRRVVNIYVLAKQLEEGCYSCEEPLRLMNTVKEQKQGLGSRLFIMCGSCSCLNTVATDTQHGTRKCKIWDVNSKAALGMLNAGIGCTVINKFLAALNIPTLASSTLKKREREVGPVIECVAKRSCENAVAKELSMSSCDGEQLSIAASFDGAWQKRGSGHAYNSLSGHASMIGKVSGEIIAFDTRCKQCRTCQSAEKNNREPVDHDCRKNWNGSAKAMEASMCVSMIKDVKEKHNVDINTLIMDDDSTSIAKVRNEVNPSVTKANDSNHLKKSFTSKLYAISKKHRSLNSSLISHLGKCFMYAIKQNENDSENIAKSLKSITPHIFGDHEFCCTSWCGYLKDPHNYVPKHLPYKRYLTDSNLKIDLSEIFNGYACQSHKLTHIGSTQKNESFNRCVTSKNPKQLHYSSSESTCFRVAAAVADNNVGNSYITKVNESLLLSPGEFTMQACETNERKRKKQGEFQKSTKFKKGRIESKDRYKKDTKAKEIREGVTYLSGVHTTSYDEDVCEEVPPPRVEPILEQLHSTKYEEVMFDLETTGLGLSDIVQLAAISTNSYFNQYVTSKTAMTLEATKVTGITTTKNGQVFKDGELMDACSLTECLTSFMKWLDTLKTPVILVAHNARFDADIFVNCCEKINCLENMSKLVIGFIDTLRVFKKLYPGRKSYSQEALVKDLIGQVYSAHDAYEDCKSLNLLFHYAKECQKENVEDSMLSSSFTITYIQNKLEYNQCKSVNLSTLKPLIDSSVVSKLMGNKIASSGLSLQSLKLVHSRDKENGIKLLFTEKVQNKCRVTNCKKIIEKCKSFLHSF